jgi:hypothetical protein
MNTTILAFLLGLISGAMFEEDLCQLEEENNTEKMEENNAEKTE